MDSSVGSRKINIYKIFATSIRAHSALCNNSKRDNSARKLTACAITFFFRTARNL